MKLFVTLALVAAISVQIARGTNDASSDTPTTAKKRFGFPPYGFHNFLFKPKAYKDDDKDDDSDDSDRGYHDICPPQSMFPTRQKCREGSVKDKDKNCESRACIFYPSDGFTVRPSYLDLFNIPPYYRYMFSKKIVRPSPYGNLFGGYRQTPYFPQISGFPQQPGFPQQHGFPQQPGFQMPGQPNFPPQMQFGQTYPSFASPAFPQSPFSPSPGNFPGYSPYQQNIQPNYPQTSPYGVQSQAFPPQSAYPGQGMAPIPPPPPPPPPVSDGIPSGFAPPKPAPPSSNSPGSKRSFFFPGQGVPGSPTGQLPNLQYGGNPFGQSGFGQSGFGQSPFGGSNLFSANGPIIARFCRNPGKICKCESEDECKCDADRPKVCTQRYADDGRYFWIYEWVAHSVQPQNPINPHQHNQQATGTSGVYPNNGNLHQAPILKSGQPSMHQQGHATHNQNDDIDYTQPVQPVQQTQPTGSFQLRQRFLFFQRPSGCDCEVPKPNRNPYGFFS